MRLLKLFCAGLVILSASVVLAQGPQPGDPDIGDPYYPGAGNGGYDVQNYLLDLTVDVENNLLNGKATIDAKATEDLSAFNFDLIGLDVSAVTVNGADAAFTQEGETELTITPAEPIRTDGVFTVVIDYEGTPTPVEDPSLEGAELGWVSYSGGTYVTSEPLGSSSWYPVNDHPSDKATYTFRVTVPEPYSAAANGVLIDTIDNGDTQTFVWEMNDPMASYLATLNVGEFAVQTENGPNGLPIRNYFPADKADELAPAFAGTSDWIALFEERFGPYPFDAYGVIVIDTDLGFALETQTMSLFSASNIADDFEIMPGLTYAAIVAGHELSHQWFGDSLTPARWQDIWLNEGFATYAEVLMVEHLISAEAADSYAAQLYLVLLIQEVGRNPEATVGDLVDTIIAKMGQDAYDETIAPLIGDSLDEIKDMPASTVTGAMGMDESEPVIIGDPGSDALFSLDVYYRGGMTLHALRAEVGDEVFFNILRTYVERYSYSSVTTDDFIAVAEEISGQPLGDLFDEWLFQAELPPVPVLNR